MTLSELLPMLTVVGWCALGACLAPLVYEAIMALPGKAAPDAAPGQRRTRRLIIGCALAGAFGWLAWRHGLSPVTVVLSVYAVVFVIIAGIDVDHHLILNRVIGPVALFALLVSPALPDMSIARVLLGAASGFLLLLLPAAIMPAGMGGGDVKLAGVLGLATGFPGILTTLATGIILGGVTTLVLLAARRIGRRDYIPYGPFLLAGAVLVFVRW
jgi:leader peptidase (prepilin peptidase)/N-methyltransferase